MGGLTEAGFVDGSLLLAVSHQGLGVVDLASGELMAGDRQETRAWFDAARRKAKGSDPGLPGTSTPSGTPAVCATTG